MANEISVDYVDSIITTVSLNVMTYQLSGKKGETERLRWTLIEFKNNRLDLFTLINNCISMGVLSQNDIDEDILSSSKGVYVKDLKSDEKEESTPRTHEISNKCDQDICEVEMTSSIIPTYNNDKVQTANKSQESIKNKANQSFAQKKVNKAVDAERIKNNPKYHQFIKSIDDYNVKAKKWGYGLISFNLTELTLKGIFVAKTNPNKGFWDGMKSRYRDGYLEEDYYKIIRLCRELGGIRLPKGIDWSKVK